MDIFQLHFLLPPWNLLFIAWTILMPFIIPICVFELFSRLEISTFCRLSPTSSSLGASFWCLDNFDSFFFHVELLCILEISTFCHLSLTLSSLGASFWCLDNFDSFFFMWNCCFLSFGAFFKAFITTFPLGEYVTFCHSLTFGVTFWYLEIFFSWNGWIKVDKNAKKNGKVSRPGLYKSDQVSNKYAIRLLVRLLVTVWTSGKCGQMPPNKAKRNCLLLM